MHRTLWQAGALDLDTANIFLMGMPEPLSPFLGTTLLLMHHIAKVSGNDKGG